MNKVMLIGNVGKEPDVRYYEQDQAVAQLPLATTERGYTLQNGTQVPDHTDWHNLVFYRGLAKVVEQYVHKGDKLAGTRIIPLVIEKEKMEARFMSTIWRCSHPRHRRAGTWQQNPYNRLKRKATHLFKTWIFHF